MRLADRIARLERTMQPEDAYRLLVIPDGADTEYRERTGYRGLLIVLSEDDARL